MGFDASLYVPGDVWAYREHDYSPSQQVEIVGVTPGKQSAKVEIAFCDEPDRDNETVPGRRLRVRWDDVAAFDALMANWQRISDDSGDLDEVEQSCIDHTFELLIPQDIAEVAWSRVKYALEIHDLSGLAERTGLSGQDVTSTGQWFDLDGTIMLSPVGALAIAQAACRRNPVPVLDWIIEQETEIRHKCKHGSERLSYRTRANERTSPEFEYHWYLTYERPRFELLRQWCGHRAVTFQERLVAAEAEVRRLDLLVVDLLGALEHAGDKHLAMHYRIEHERDRITPERARPIIDRPLDPSELPVIEVPRRRRWR